jgi:hypothetical protein
MACSLPVWLPSHIIDEITTVFECQLAELLSHLNVRLLSEQAESARRPSTDSSDSHPFTQQEVLSPRMLISMDITDLMDDFELD